MPLPELDPVGWAVGITAIFTAAGLIWRYVYKPLRSAHGKLVKAADSILGYPAVVDPATGIVIQEATPAMANRVYTLEVAMTQLTAVVGKTAEIHTELSRTHDLLAALQARYDSLLARWDERDKAGLQIVEEWTKWRNQHELEAQAREERLAEWDRWRQEQTLMTAAVANEVGLPQRPKDDK